MQAEFPWHRNEKQSRRNLKGQPIVGCQLLFWKLAVGVQYAGLLLRII